MAMNDGLFQNDSSITQRRGFPWLLGICMFVALGTVIGGLVLATPEEVPNGEPEPPKVQETAVRKARPTKIETNSEIDPLQQAKIKQELLDNVLHGFFNRIAGNNLSAEQNEKTWKALREMLDRDADMLARAVLHPPANEVVEARLSVSLVGGSTILAIPELTPPETQLQRCRELLVQSLRSQVRRDRLNEVEREILLEANKAAGLLAEHLQHELREKVGQAMGTKLNQLRESDAATRLKYIEQVEPLFEQAIEASKEAIRVAEKADPIFKENFEKLAKAREKKDTPGQTQAAAAIRERKNSVSNGASVLAKASVDMKYITDKPYLGANIDEFIMEVRAANQKAKDEVYEASQHFGSLTNDVSIRGPLLKGAEFARENMKLFERSRAAIRLELMRERLDALAEQVAVHARTTSLIRDLKEPERLKSINDTVKAIAKDKKAADKFVDQVESMRKLLVAGGNTGLDELDAIKKTLKDNAGKLDRFAGYLDLDSAKETAEGLKVSAAQLARLDVEMAKLQGKLGMKEHANPSSNARRQVESLFKSGKLSAPLADTFAVQYKRRVLEVAGKKFEESVSKRLQNEMLLDPEAQQRISSELAKIFGDQMIERIASDKQIRLGLELALAPAPIALGELEKPDDRTTGGAQGIVDQMAIGYGLFLEPASRHAILSGFNKAAIGPYKPSPSPLVVKLEELNNQLAAGRTALLDQGDTTNLTTTRLKVLEDSQLKKAIKQQPTGNTPPLTFLAGAAAAEETPKQRNLPFRPTVNRLVGIPMVLSTAITIDGKLDDWKDLPRLAVRPVVQGSKIGTVKTDEQRVWVAYSVDGLLIAADVDDTSGKLEDHIAWSVYWANDAIEVFVDTLNTKTPKRGEPHTHQFVVYPLGHKDEPDIGGYENFAPEVGAWQRVPIPGNVLRRAGQKRDRGWTVEMLIPHSHLRGGKLVAGRTIGFNLRIDNGNDLYWYFTHTPKLATNYHPESWGDALLLGTDGLIELISESGETRSAIVPGQPLRVRVRDIDADADSAKVERTFITVRTDSGELENILLEETNANSGVFEGSIATRLNTGDSVTGVLSVFEGEGATIEYLDRVRAYGERDVRVKKTVPVGSLLRKVR